MHGCTYGEKVSWDKAIHQWNEKKWTVDKKIHEESYMDV